MCDVALKVMFGLPIRRPELFLLVFNCSQVCRTLTIYLLPVAVLGQFKGQLQFLAQALFIRLEPPLTCELAKCAFNRHSDKYTSCICNMTLAPPPNGWEMLRTFFSEGVGIHVSRPVAENQWKNNKMNSLSQRKICDGTDCLSAWAKSCI